MNFKTKFGLAWLRAMVIGLWVVDVRAAVAGEAKI